MMSGAKAPDFDAYGLLRAMHSHNPSPLFAYRGIIIPLLCSYRGGSYGLLPTYEQAHVGLDLLTLASLKLQKRRCPKGDAVFLTKKTSQDSTITISIVRR